MPSGPTGTQPSGLDSVAPGATTAAGWSTVAPASSALGPLHDRQAPSPGGQWAARRHRRPLSGSQRAFPNPRGYSRVPPKIRRVPVNGVSHVSQLRRPRPVRHTGVHLDCNRACRRAVVEVLFRADYRARPQGHRSSSQQLRQQEHRRAGELGIRTPPRPSGTAAWPSAGRSASESSLSGPLSAFQTRGCTPGYPPKSERLPVNAVFSASLTPPDSPRLHPYLEQLFDTGAPSPRRGTRQRFTASLTQTPHHLRCRFPRQPLKQATQERFRPQRRDHSELPSSGSSRPSD